MGQMSQEQINVDLFNEVMRLKGELKEANERIQSLENELEEMTEDRNKWRSNSLDYEREDELD